MLTPVETAGKLDWVRAMITEGRAEWAGGRPALTPRVRSRGKPASEMVLEDRR